MAAVIPTVVERVLESIAQIIKKGLSLGHKIRSRVSKRVDLIQLVRSDMLQAIHAYLKLFDREWARRTIGMGSNKLRIVEVIEDTRIVAVGIATVGKVGIIDRLLRFLKGQSFAFRSPNELPKLCPRECWLEGVL